MHANSKEFPIPENGVRRESVFALHGPASFPSVVDDVRPVPVLHRDEEMSACPGLYHARALFS